MQPGNRDGEPLLDQGEAQFFKRDVLARFPEGENVGRSLLDTARAHISALRFGGNAAGSALLRIARLRGEAYSEGIQTVTKYGAPIRVYSVAKTVTDCFKFRNKIGLDVALEALKDAWRSRKVTMDELRHFAKINRVERVMQPYLEAVAA